MSSQVFSPLSIPLRERDESAVRAWWLVGRKVKRAPAGQVRSKAGGGLELVKIA